MVAVVELEKLSSRNPLPMPVRRHYGGYETYLLPQPLSKDEDSDASLTTEGGIASFRSDLYRAECSEDETAING